MHHCLWLVIDLDWLLLDDLNWGLLDDLNWGLLDQLNLWLLDYLNRGLKLRLLNYLHLLYGFSRGLNILQNDLGRTSRNLTNLRL